MGKQHLPGFIGKIYSEAVVRSASGESLLDSPELVTSENVDRFYASEALVEEAEKRLQSKGFEVLDKGNISITIAAPPEVYERSLNTTLERVERPVLKELGQVTTGTFLNAIDSKPFGEIDVSQTDFAQVLDGIAINEPIYYVQSGKPSATPPPNTSQDYLRVPKGVAKGLNATLAHQQGITGKGVRVAMVDSGWYAHPFFRKNNYQVKIELAPGATNKAEDDNGHGTGESANIFAVAPEVSLTMVKADIDLSGRLRNVSSISAFRTAVALKPDIISCSWGSNQRQRTLSPQNRVLAATVADAVRQGIIVIFSAGNGTYGFPAQHREVIAAGGVYYHLTGSLKGQIEASNYASSFISPVYPNRSVPDVCGLVGKLPQGSYIMLPVPRGSKIDRGLAILEDGTEPDDAWAAFSGTSAAAPQLAGICALMKQINPQLSPAEAKRILQETARDVVGGSSHPSSGSASARAGPDIATGYGLANAYEAVKAVKGIAAKNIGSDNIFLFQNTSQLNSTPASQSKELTPVSQLDSKTIRKKPMYSEFPKLHKKLDEIRWKFERELQSVIDEYDLEDVELIISEANFIPRSPIQKVAHSLREKLDSCFETKENAIELDQDFDYLKSITENKIDEQDLKSIVETLGKGTKTKGIFLVDFIKSGVKGESGKVLLKEINQSLQIKNQKLKKELTEKIKESIQETQSKKNTGKIHKSKITTEHISSAQALLKIGRYQDLAIRVLTEALLVCGDDIEKSLRHIPKDSNSEKEAEKLRKFASDALSSCSSEIASFDAKSRSGVKLPDYQVETSSGCYVEDGITYCPK